MSLLLASLLTLATQTAQAQLARADSAAGATIHALLVGCDSYPRLQEALGSAYVSELRLEGPSNDVGLVRTTLERRFGLRPERTRVLAGWGAEAATRPTRANILHALEELGREVRDGDLAIVYLAGHGSQQAAPEARWLEEPDGLDEVFLAADAGLAQANVIEGAIRDDELGASVRRLRDAGARVWLIVDACHSGGLLRGGSTTLRLRGLAPERLGVRMPERGRAETETAPGAAVRAAPSASWLDESSDRIVCMYAAQSYGRAPEMPLPRGDPVARVHGLFTYLLCQQLERADGTESYRELGASLIAAYQAFPCRITVPGAEGDLDRPLDSARQERQRGLLCTRRPDGIFLDAGVLAGVEAGARVRLLAPGEDEPQATLGVVGVGLYEARCELTSGELGEENAWRAELESRSGKDWRLALAVVRADGGEGTAGELPIGLREWLEREQERFPLTTRELADWWIVLGEDGDPWLRPGPLEDGFDVFCGGPTELPTQLQRIQRSRSLRRYCASAAPGGSERELELWVERRDGRGVVERLERGGTLHPGDELRILLKKRDSSVVDLHVFYIDAEQRVHGLFPAARASPRIRGEVPEARALTGSEESEWLPVVDDALGLEHLVVLAIPRTEASPEIDLSWLEDADTTRGGAALPPSLAELRTLCGGTDSRGQPLVAREPSQSPWTRLLTLRTEWSALRAPAWPELGVVERAPPAVTGTTTTGLPPDPWEVGTRAALTRSPAGETDDVLLLGDREVRCVLIDFDGLGARGEDLAQCLHERSFDAEAAFLFAEEGTYAYYDERDSGSFDLVLVDQDRDGIADERWTRRGEEWQVVRGISLPWLSQAYVSARARRNLPAEVHGRRLAILAAGGH